MVPGINDNFQGQMAQANGYQNAANALASGVSSGVNNLVSLGTFAYGGGFGGGTRAVSPSQTGGGLGGIAYNPATGGYSVTQSNI